MQTPQTLPTPRDVLRRHLLHHRIYILRHIVGVHGPRPHPDRVAIRRREVQVRRTYSLLYLLKQRAGVFFLPGDLHWYGDLSSAAEDGFPQYPREDGHDAVVGQEDV